MSSTNVFRSPTLVRKAATRGESSHTWCRGGSPGRGAGWPRELGSMCSWRFQCHASARRALRPRNAITMMANDKIGHDFWISPTSRDDLMTYVVLQ